MTEEEAFALDEHYTNNPPKVDPAKARIRIPLVRIDTITAEYLSERARVTRKRLEEILGNMVWEKISMGNL